MIRLEGQLVFGHHVLEFTQSEGPQGSQAVGAGRSVLSCLAINVLSGDIRVCTTLTMGIGSRNVLSGDFVACGHQSMLTQT